MTVWLPGPAAEPTTVTWVGTLPGVTGERELPGATASGPATVRAVPADGWVVEPLPDSPAVRVRVRILPPAPPAAPSLLETTERTADGLTYRAVVGLPLAAGRPHRFRVSIHDLPPGVTPALRATGARVGPVERVGETMSWAVDADGPITLTLTAKLAPPARLPEVLVRFDGPPLTWGSRGLVVGAGLTADGRAASPGDREAVRAAWPGEADRGTVWTLDEDERHTVSIEQPAPTPPTLAATPTPPPAIRFEPSWLRATGWLLAFGLMLAARPAVPERLAAVGVLGAAAVGGGMGWGFLAVAAVGVALRLARLLAVALR